MFCKSCGNELKEGAKFCSKCGAKVAEENAPEIKAEAAAAPSPAPAPETAATAAPAPAKKSAVKPVLIACAAVLAVLVAVSAVILYKGESKKDDDSSARSVDSRQDRPENIVEYYDGEYQARGKVFQDDHGKQGGSCEVKVQVEDHRIVKVEAVLFDEDNKVQRRVIGTAVDKDKPVHDDLTLGEDELRGDGGDMPAVKLVEDGNVIAEVPSYADEDDGRDALDEYVEELIEKGSIDSVEPDEDSEIVFREFESAVDIALEDAVITDEDDDGESTEGSEAYTNESEQEESSEEESSEEESSEEESSEEEEPVDPKALELAQIVIDNEDVWLTPYNEFLKPYSYDEERASVVFDGGDDIKLTSRAGNCWFEDVDMDGEMEFVCGGFNMNLADNYEGTMGPISFYDQSVCYCVYEFVDGGMKLVQCTDDTGRKSLAPHTFINQTFAGFGNDSEINYQGFAAVNAEMHRDGDAHTYYFFGHDGDFGFCVLPFCYDGSGMTAYSGDKCGSIAMGRFMRDYSFGEGVVDVPTFKQLATDYYTAHPMTRVNVKSIPCTVASSELPLEALGFEFGLYDSMSDEEKLKALCESYESWSAEDTDEPGNICQILLDNAL